MTNCTEVCHNMSSLRLLNKGSSVMIMLVVGHNKNSHRHMVNVNDDDEVSDRVIDSVKDEGFSALRPLATSSVLYD